MDDPEYDLSSIERRVAATRTIRRIMHAIWVVSRSQYARAEKLSTESVKYYRWVDEALARLAGPAAVDESDKLSVVFGPERALCGGLVAAIEREIPTGQDFALVGARLTQNSELATRALFTLPGVSATADFDQRASELGHLLLEHERGRAVELVYATAPTGGIHRELLLAGRRLNPDPRLETYSPAATLLEAIIEQSLTGRVTHALAQTLQAELGARILIAQRARSHCDDSLAKLEEAWRVVQKDQITNELGEVVAARQQASGRA